jgi:hypothetical protein
LKQEEPDDDEEVDDEQEDDDEVKEDEYETEGEEEEEEEEEENEYTTFSAVVVAADTVPSLAAAAAAAVAATACRKRPPAPATRTTTNPVTVAVVTPDRSNTAVIKNKTARAKRSKKGDGDYPAWIDNLAKWLVEVPHGDRGKNKAICIAPKSTTRLYSSSQKVGHWNGYRLIRAYVWPEHVIFMPDGRLHQYARF